MARETACRNCAQKKVGCKAVAGSNICERCARKGIACERPVPPAVPTSNLSRKTACESCRKNRTKCERDVNAVPATCVHCAAAGLPCSFAMPRASTSASGTQPNLVVDTASASATPDSAPSSTRSPSRPFWETVLAPSPGVDG
ncbi:uncharacterized protein TRAVEDRAFT_57773 [Trametes versicolor FP-101664 SS1]|uniref:uncharacterized protein n=1 Tax=Trametes versicolor (strain FP-101664) TaxID=717944 RepID=UPI0004622A5D|nr:uncharacterized protein TRAVEDRAFT_57773 [Trametes versicolor FP-101664 SS1]EIW60568.1 hypothetical protein TRAVEDRAFT_57773 [Trametes versicolor FP-101664 SS1]